jgi:hypothetical protein
MEELRLQKSHGNDESGYPLGTGVKSIHMVLRADDEARRKEEEEEGRQGGVANDSEASDEVSTDPFDEAVALFEDLECFRANVENTWILMLFQKQLDALLAIKDAEGLDDWLYEVAKWQLDYGWVDYANSLFQEISKRHAKSEDNDGFLHAKAAQKGGDFYLHLYFVVPDLRDTEQVEEHKKTLVPMLEEKLVKIKANIEAVHQRGLDVRTALALRSLLASNLL